MMSSPSKERDPLLCEMTAKISEWSDQEAVQELKQSDPERWERSRQFVLGLFGTALALFLHRWIAVTNQLPTKAIIATDFCILGVGFINMLPRIQTGITLALFCAGIAIMSHMYPQLIWLGTLLFAVVAPMIMLIDWWREKNNE